MLDGVNSVAYRTGPKDSMSTVATPQWLEEPSSIRFLSNNRKLAMYVDNYSIHNMTPILLSTCQAINTEMGYFPVSATHSVQPCDSHPFQQVMSVSSTRWEKHKLQTVRKNKLTDSSGNLQHP